MVRASTPLQHQRWRWQAFGDVVSLVRDGDGARYVLTPIIRDGKPYIATQGEDGTLNPITGEEAEMLLVAAAPDFYARVYPEG